MTNEREVRRWSQAEAGRAMRAHAPGELPEDASLLRQWKRWESGQKMPSEFYQPIIAKTSGPSPTPCSRCHPSAIPTQRSWQRAGWTRWSWSPTAAVGPG